MRIPVLSFCIVLSLFVAPVVLAQENAPGYFNDRSYPNSVSEKQKESGGFLEGLCKAVWGLGLFECEGYRSYEVIFPESESIEKEEIQDANASAVQGLATEAQLDQLGKEIDEATTSAQVLGIIDIFNSIFGGRQNENGFINSYKPYNSSLCDSGDSNEDCTTKLAVALRPASMQETMTPTPTPLPPQFPYPPIPDPDVPIPTSGPQLPPGGDTSGYDLVAGIKAACKYNGTPGRVHETNADCLYNVSPRLGFGVIPELRNSALAYTNLQCVGFVRGMNLHFKGKALDNGGNANDFATNIPTGYRLIYSVTLAPVSPKVGDLLLWNTGAFGHIAYVITVYDINTVDVIEANWGVDGLVQVRRINVRAGDILGWLTQS